MPNTVPNQKVVHIHKEKVNRDFLQISKENWYAANKDLEPYGLQLYLYLAGNADGFDLALSQKAAEEAGIKKTSFNKYVNVLIEKGYLVQRSEGSNIYDFYERPKSKENAGAVPPCEQTKPPHGNQNPQDKQNQPQDNREINNIYGSKDNDIYNKNDELFVIFIIDIIIF